MINLQNTVNTIEKPESSLVYIDKVFLHLFRQRDQVTLKLLLLSLDFAKLNKNKIIRILQIFIPIAKNFPNEFAYALDKSGLSQMEKDFFKAGVK